MTSTELREQADKLDQEASGYEWTAEQIRQCAERTRTKASVVRKQAVAVWFEEQDQIRQAEFPLKPPLWL